MIPDNFVILSDLPYLANGKLNRNALPPPPPLPTSSIETHADPFEDVVASTWYSVIAVMPSRSSNFFEIGGHSLAAARVLAALEHSLGIAISMREFFENPTVRELTSLIRSSKNSHDTALPITRTGTLDAPLSFSQKRMWFLHHVLGQKTAYNMVEIVHLNGTLNCDALEASAAALIHRHSSLRTKYLGHGFQPHQTICEVAWPSYLKDQLRINTTTSLHVLRWEKIFYTSSTNQTVEDAAKMVFEQLSEEAANIEEGYLMKFVLLKKSENSNILALRVHHIASDGWSSGIIWRELSTVYNQFSKPDILQIRDQIPLQYIDFAVWQQVNFTQERLQHQLKYWKTVLHGELPSLLTFSDKPRPSVQTTNGADVTARLPSKVIQKLKGIARLHGATLFMVLLSGFFSMLYRYTLQPDLLVGIPVASRTRREMEEIVGFFVNTLTIRANCTHDSSEALQFGELVTRIKDASIGAFSNQDVPFEQVVDAIQPNRDASHHPLFQTMFVMQNGPGVNSVFSGLEVCYITAAFFFFF